MTPEEASRLRRRLRFLSRSLKSLGESMREHLQEIERHSKSLRVILHEHDKEFAEMCEEVDVPAWSATLTVRARNVLRRLGVVDSKSLSGLDENKLRGARNCGQGCFEEIRDSLAAIGVVLPELPVETRNA